MSLWNSELHRNELKALPTEEHLTHASYYRYHLGLWTKKLRYPINFRVAGHVQQPNPFQRRESCEAYDGRPWPVENLPSLRNRLFKCVFLQHVFSFPVSKSFSGLENVWEKCSRNDPKGTECLLLGEQCSMPGSSVWEGDDWGGCGEAAESCGMQRG